MRGRSAAFATFFLLAAAFTGTVPAAADVNIKNGKFFETFDFVPQQEDNFPSFSVVYNSGTLRRGIFGWGWGSRYEDRLKVLGDGLIIEEFGSGSSHLFHPAAPGPQSLARVVAILLENAKTEGAFGKADQEAAFRQRLESEAGFRKAQWEMMVRAHKVVPPPVAIGAQFASAQFDFQYVSRTAEGYLRKLPDGLQELFSEDGTLRKIWKPNGEWIALEYDARHRLSRWTSEQAQVVSILYNEQGFVRRIEAPHGFNADFAYDLTGNLTGVSIRQQSAFRFEYAMPSQHRLTGIFRPDGRATKIAYYDAGDHKDWVQEVRPAEGASVTYAYEGDGLKPGRYSVTTVERRAGGLPARQQSGEYFTHATDTGETKTYRSVVVADGKRTETLYNDCCGLPTMVKVGANETHYEYGPQGQVVRRASANESVVATYDPGCRKPARVTYTLPAARWFQYEYDPRCNPSKVSDSSGRGVLIFYDSNDQPKRLLYRNSGRRVEVEYDDGKPVKITPTPGTALTSPEQISPIFQEVVGNFTAMLNDGLIGPR